MYDPTVRIWAKSDSFSRYNVTISVEWMQRGDCDTQIGSDVLQWRWSLQFCDIDYVSPNDTISVCIEWRLPFDDKSCGIWWLSSDLLRRACWDWRVAERPQIHHIQMFTGIYLELQTNTYNKPYASIELHSKNKRKGQVAPMMLHPNDVIPWNICSKFGPQLSTMDNSPKPCKPVIVELSPCFFIPRWKIKY